MARILLLLSAIFLITTFGLHTAIISGNRLHRPRYTNRPFLMILPWLCGLILPVFAWGQLTHIHWGWLLLLNFVVVFFISPILAQVALQLSRKRKKIGRKVLTVFSLGLICLIIGTILR